VIRAAVTAVERGFSFVGWQSEACPISNLAGVMGAGADAPLPILGLNFYAVI